MLARLVILAVQLSLLLLLSMRRDGFSLAVLVNAAVLLFQVLPARPNLVGYVFKAAAGRWRNAPRPTLHYAKLHGPSHVGYDGGVVRGLLAVLLSLPALPNHVGYDAGEARGLLEGCLGLILLSWRGVGSRRCVSATHDTRMRVRLC